MRLVAVVALLVIAAPCASPARSRIANALSVANRAQDPAAPAPVGRVPRATQARPERPLAPALGQLGTVEVVDLDDLPRDKWDPLWQQFDDKGFSALGASRDLNGVKTHFLKLEYHDGQYHLESRQHDGFSGLASPVVRKQNVRAPELVGRTAGLMLDRDFGLAGTVEAGRRDEARIIPRAGQVGSIERFVKVGDIFAVSQVKKTNRPAPPPVRTATGKIIAPPPGSVPPPGLSADPRTYTLLRVNELGKDGVLHCTVLTMWAKPLDPTRAAGSSLHEARHGGRAPLGAPG